jgi:uncharacterized protein (UPF0332 family)
MIELADDYFAKARESLEGAQSEFINDRYNNCANRCYYAVFQAAIAALIGAGIAPPGRSGEWGHDFVQAQFIGQLINRRKMYPTALRNTLARNYALREKADYERDDVPEIQAARAVRRTEEFVETVHLQRTGSR